MSNVEKRTFTDEEILHRLLFGSINEFCKILEEGKAIRASDIDIVWINGYGFHIAKGGPMHWADSVGLAKIAASLTEYAKLTGDETLKPAPLLAKLAAEGKGFASLAAGKG